MCDCGHLVNWKLQQDEELQGEASEPAVEAELEAVAAHEGCTRCGTTDCCRRHVDPT